MGKEEGVEMMMEKKEKEMERKLRKRGEIDEEEK